MTRNLLNLLFLFFFPSNHHSQKENTNIQSPYDNFPSYSGGFGFHRPNLDWVEMPLQPFPFSTHYTQGMSYIIRNLEPDQQYEAKVQARWVKLIGFFQLALLTNHNWIDGEVEKTDCVAVMSRKFEFYKWNSTELTD